MWQCYLGTQSDSVNKKETSKLTNVKHFPITRIMPQTWAEVYVKVGAKYIQEQAVVLQLLHQIMAARILMAEKLLARPLQLNMPGLNSG